MLLTNPLPHPVEVRLPHLLTGAAAGPAPETAAHPRAATRPTAGPAASTYGWDTAFAINIADVNRAIEKFAVSPADFHYVPPDRSCTLSGRFGTWRVRRGGDGAIIHLAVPVTAGSLEWNGTSYPMNAATATVEVRLNYLPPDPAGATEGGGGPATGSPHRLVVHTAATASEPVASVTDLTFAGEPPSFIARALMAGGLQGWMNENLAKFSHVFAVVDLNRMVDHAQFQWLAPTSTGYAYVDGTDEHSSYLGVLCMTEGRGADHLAPQISTAAVPTGSRSGFLISADRMLTKMVLPALPHAFAGSSSADFALSPDGTAVVNLRPIRTKTVEHAGITYQPWIQKLRITLDAAEVVIDTLTTVEIGLGATAHVKNTAYQRIKLATAPGGTQTLVWEDARPPVTDHWTTMDPGTSIAAEVIGLIVLAVLTVLTDGAVLVVALIIVAIVVGLVEATPQLIANVVGRKVSDASPSLSLLALNSTDPIVWSGAKQFALDSAGLNGALQLGGDPRFTT